MITHLYTMYIVEEFSPAEIQLYEKRFEEGYDIFDPRYEKWLDSTNTKIRGTCSSEESTSGSTSLRKGMIIF